MADTLCLGPRVLQRHWRTPAYPGQDGCSPTSVHKESVGVKEKHAIVRTSRRCFLSPTGFSGPKSSCCPRSSRSKFSAYPDDLLEAQRPLLDPSPRSPKVPLCPRALLAEDVPASSAEFFEYEHASLEGLFLRQTGLYGPIFRVRDLAYDTHSPQLSTPLEGYPGCPALLHPSEQGVTAATEGVRKVHLASCGKCEDKISSTTFTPVQHKVSSPEVLSEVSVSRGVGGAGHTLVPGQVLQAVLESEAPQARGEQRSPGDDYHVNVGYAIRTLRDELPTLFQKEMSYDIYRDDITFQDPLNVFHGIKSYSTIFWALRFHGRIFFRALWVDVNRVWQPDERTIIVRWSVHGIPRVPWAACGRFDGTSTYKLDSSGKIFVHKVDNVAFSDPPKYRPLTVVELLQLSAVNRVPGVTCFTAVARAASTAVSNVRNIVGLAGEEERTAEQGSCASVSNRTVPAGAPLIHGLGSSELNALTWVRFYLALASTLAIRDDLDFAARALLLA